MADQPFIIQAHRTDSALPMDEYRATTPTEALSTAYALAIDRKYRQVIVTDDGRIIWAQFNLLWEIIPG